MKTLLSTIVLHLGLLLVAEPVLAYKAEVSAYSAQSMTGETVDLHQFVGSKPLYIKLWASWCIPCNEQMPHYQRAYEEYGDRIQFVSVNLGVNDDPQSVRAMIEQYGLTMPTIIDHNGALAKAFNLIGTPWHVVLDKDGDLIHKGHKVDDSLNRRLRLMASVNPNGLPEIKLEKPEQPPLRLPIDEPGVTALYFTSAWCDWYLRESRPAYSENCRVGQELVNRMERELQGVHWLGVLSRLWTTSKELSDYKTKYKITHSLAIDYTNDAFIGFGVTQFPTLILIKEGKEFARVTDFSNGDGVISTLRRAL